MSRIRIMLLVITYLFSRNLENCFGIDPLLSKLHHAEKLREEGLIDEAIPLYKKILQTSSVYPLIEKNLAPYSTIKLAACQLASDQFIQAIALLASLKTTPLSPFAVNKDFLLATAHRYLNHHEQALALLLSSHEAIFNQERALEIGLNLFYLNRTSQALPYLKSVVHNPLIPAPYFIAQLYLAKAALNQGDFAEADHILHALKPLIPPHHPLQTEIYYWQGINCFQSHNMKGAIYCFEKALQNLSSRSSEWGPNSLYYLAHSYTQWASDPLIEKEKAGPIFAKAIHCADQLVAQMPEENSYLTLGHCYVAQAKKMEDPSAYEKAREILIKPDLISSKKGRFQALLLCANAAPTYAQRNALYQKLTDYDKAAWFSRGMNDLEEGLTRKKEGEPLLHHAAQSFNQARLFFSEQANTTDVIQAAKYEALSLYYAWKLQEAWNLLKEMPETEASEELTYLTALIGASIHRQNPTVVPFPILETLLLNGIQKWPTNDLIQMTGALYFHAGEFQKGDQLFTDLLTSHPDSPNRSEWLLWKAKCAEQLNDVPQKKMWLQQVYENEPESPFAPIAYFSTYSYAEYLRGSRKAIKHLQALPQIFPNHPLIINAYYLIGLDHKKDHLSEEGKILRHKNWIAAIDDFALAESAFDALSQAKSIPPKDLPYYTKLRIRSILERALANLAIAEESQGSKRHIYLDYAEEVLKKLRGEFKETDPYSPLSEETEFWLLQTYLKSGKDNEAFILICQMNRKYEDENIKQNYFLSRIWAEKALLYQKNQDYSMALKALDEAERTAKGLSIDEKLDLWIQKSLCYKDRGQLDEAMRILSRVVNDEAISALRVKALYLRAEIYELQGRPELAMKQLEATSKKGGMWGKKAKEKLDKYYAD